MSESKPAGSNTILTNFSRNWPEVKGRLVVLLTVFLLLLLVVFAYFFNRIFINIYPGQAGVLWQRFQGGTDMDQVYNEGFHIIPPWDRMYIYDTRIQHRPFAFEALSKDGLSIQFEVSVRFHPDRAYLPQLHKNVGPDYIAKVVEPETQAHLRKVVANYLPEEIYTSEGYILQIIMQGAMGAFAEKHTVLDNLLIRRMTLPPTIVAAIERKLAQEQYLQEYNYRLLIEEKEARRKGIEAEGIRRFQDVVKTSDFFEKYLQFKGIDATLALAQSANSKVVVIGGGGGGSLPLIMNMESSAAGGVTAQAGLSETGVASTPLPAGDQPPSTVVVPGEVEPEKAFFSRLQRYLGGQSKGMEQASPAAKSQPDKVGP